MKQSLQRQSRRNNGAILSLLVVLLLLISMTSLALIRVSQEARLRTSRNTAEVAARFAADAGIERAMHYMNKKLEFGIWTYGDVPTYHSETLPGCDADYTVTYSGDFSSGYVLTSVGKCGNRTKTIRVTLELTNPFAGDYAVFTKYSLSMKNNSTVDGYNSSDLSDTDVRVKVGKSDLNKGKIDLKNGATIDGDVVVPLDADIADVLDYKNRSSITGEILNSPMDNTLLEIDPPPYLWYQGRISGRNVTLHSHDSGKYSSISISNNGTLTIDGNLTLYVTGDIELKNGAELVVKSGGSLELYFDGDIEGKNSSGITNESKIPAKVKLFGTGEDQEIELKNSSSLYGVVYGPNVDMTLHNSAEAYGAFLVENFEMKNSGKVYYDKALKETDIYDEGACFSIVRWEEI